MTRAVVVDDPSTPRTAVASARSTRLIGIDAARGVALFGMMAVHSLYEETSPGHPTLSFAVFGGRAAAAFAVLAGVGMAFMTGRRQVRRADFAATAAMLATRALVIGAIGLALGYADAALAAVILPYYGLLFLLAIPLVMLPSWAIAVVGTVFAGGMPVLTHLLLPHLPVATLENPTVSYLVHQPLQLLSELSITGEYPALAWTPYLCAGLVIGRLTLSRIRTAVALLGTGTVLAVAAAVVSSVLLHRFGGLAQIWATQPVSGLSVSDTNEMLGLGGDGTVPVSTWWWLAIDAPHTSTACDMIGTTGSAAGLLGFMLLVSHITLRRLRRVVWLVQVPLAAAGSMTLTLYTAHIMFLNSDYDTYSAATGYLLQVAAALLIGLCWRATAGRGPLEGIVTALGKRARSRVASWRRPPDAHPAPQRVPDRPLFGTRLRVLPTADDGPVPDREPGDGPGGR